MKAYIKPELFYERYEVSQHLADCAWEFNYADQYSCNATADPNLFGFLEYPALFLDQAHQCEDLDAKEFEKYCYQNGAAFQILFMS